MTHRVMVLTKHVMVLTKHVMVLKNHVMVLTKHVMVLTKHATRTGEPGRQALTHVRLCVAGPADATEGTQRVGGSGE